MANITIDRLLNIVPDQPQQVLSHLEQSPQLASAQDSHGYSLVHAAVSYNQPDLLRALVHQYSVSIDLRDEDAETPLFAAESVEIAKVVLEECGGDVSIRNSDGQTAAEKLDEEGDYPLVSAYLRGFEVRGAAASSVTAQTGGANSAPQAEAGTMDLDASSSNGVAPPPPLPQSVKINLGTMREDQEDDEVGEPDPEFRRRIEELAARPDFQGEEAQAELRRLIGDALGGVVGETGRDTKRR